MVTINGINYVGYYVNTLNGIQYISREVSNEPLSNENAQTILTNIYISINKGMAGNDTFYVFNLSDVASLATALSLKHGESQVIAHARILGFFKNGSLVYRKSLNDFYTNVTQEELDATAW